MQIHSVYFWLQGGERSDAFEAGVADLLTDSNIVWAHFGPPLPTDRPVVDASYSYGHVMAFEDGAGHDAYQVGEPHQRFLADFSGVWERLLVYDFTTD